LTSDDPANLSAAAQWRVLGSRFNADRSDFSPALVAVPGAVMGVKPDGRARA